MKSVFISYRRGDAGGTAGRLYDRFEAKFGKGNVFFDVSDIEAREAFRAASDENAAPCPVFVAVIGQNWLKTADQYGKRRLDSPADWVRLEVSAALSRGLLVIPLLVEDAALPPGEALPGDLARLPDLEAAGVNHKTFHQDVDRLLDRIEREMNAKEGKVAVVANLPAGTIRVHPKDESEYVWVPPGTFQMGRVPGDDVADQRYDI